MFCCCQAAGLKPSEYEALELPQNMEGDNDLEDLTPDADLEDLTPDDIEDLTPDDIEDLTPDDDLENLTPDDEIDPDSEDEDEDEEDDSAPGRRHKRFIERPDALWPKGIIPFVLSDTLCK